MSAVIRLACDRDGCDTSADVSLATAAGFLRVEWDGDEADYCSVDCALASLAQLAPLERVHGVAAENRP